MNWHVCRAPADWHRLNRAIDECYRLGRDVYVPMLWVQVRKSRKVAGRRLVLEKQVAAYPGWAFAPAPILDVPGIRTLTYADGSPVLISEAAIDWVKQCELQWDRDHHSRLAVSATVIPAGTEVTITDGLFAGHVGYVVTRLRDGYAVQLDAALLGAHTITIRPQWVQVALAKAA